MSNQPRVEQWIELGSDQTWPLRDVLLKLADAADHLANDHDCDAHGYEEVQICATKAREYAAIIARHAPKEPQGADAMAHALWRMCRYADWWHPRGTIYDGLNADRRTAEAVMERYVEILYGHRTGFCDWKGVRAEMNGKTWCPKCQYSVDELSVKARAAKEPSAARAEGEK